MTPCFRMRIGHRLAAMGSVLLLLVCSTALVADDVVQAAPATPVSGKQMLDLARRGDFEQLAALLDADASAQRYPLVANLRDDLTRYREHQATRQAARQEAYQASLAEAAKLSDENKLEEALAKAIDAHSHADDAAVLLQSEQVQTLTARALTAAQDAEQRHDWLAALELYRLLDLLYEQQNRYREPVKRAEQHLRLMRLYSPKALMALYQARLDRRNDPKEEPPPAINDDWQRRLQGVRLAMLQDALKEAAHHHVSDSSYTKLIRGGLDALVLLTESESLKDTFPSLGVRTQVERFRQRLQNEITGLNRRTTALTRPEAMDLLDRVLEANSQSVQLPENVVVYELAEGAMGSLDEFSGIIWPYDLDEFNRTTQGKFFGVGILIGRTNGKLTVVSPLEGTPAHKAGIKPGDIISKVDQKTTAGWGLDEAVRTITGPEGTAVVLTLQRLGRDGEFDVRLVRSEIAIESIKGWQHKVGGGWDYYVDRQTRIGYVRMSQFIPQTPDDLDAAINQMQREQGINALILDLRFNPGGLLRKSVDVADRFVNEGVIVSTVGANGQATQRFSARARQTQPYMPMVVLINQTSASASEIVSGALQDYQRALIVGERSFGKGSVQDLFPIDTGRAVLKLTTQYYRLPGPNGQGGRIIHRRPEDKTWGVEPDLHVPMTEKEVADALEARRDADVLREAGEEAPKVNADDLLSKGLDVQLEAALLYLKTQLAARDLMLARSDESK